MVRPPRIMRSLMASALLVCVAAQPTVARMLPMTVITDPHWIIYVPASYPDDALERAVAVHLPLARRLVPEDGYPRSIDWTGDWALSRPRQWTSGFFAGILWQLYDCTGKADLLKQATRWTDGLRPQTTIPSHDVGFVIGSSFGRGYDSTGREEYRLAVIEAAEHLASRFDPRVGAIRSLGEDRALTYPVYIDNMMNLELLFWAARNGGADSLAQIAVIHATTTARDHVRPDGTTFHVVDYDPESGAVLWRGTLQGLSDESTWSRGQAWGLYGFTVAYRETGEPQFLDTARRLADAFLERLPADWIPCWDFDAACIPGEPKDASAAAVAASGLWELATLVEDWATSRRYRWASLSLVDRLFSDEYSATGKGLPALLLHSTGNRPRDKEVDVPVIYAEYYFIEALLRQASDSSVELARATLVNYPNPFNPRTNICYELPDACTVSLRVHDVSGRVVSELVRNEWREAGPHAVVWRGTDGAGRHVASGVYFLRLETEGRTVERKTVLLR